MMIKELKYTFLRIDGDTEISSREGLC